MVWDNARCWAAKHKHGQAHLCLRMLRLAALGGQLRLAALALGLRLRLAALALGCAWPSLRLAVRVLRCACAPLCSAIIGGGIKPTTPQAPRSRMEFRGPAGISPADTRGGAQTVMVEQVR